MKVRTSPLDEVRSAPKTCSGAALERTIRITQSVKELTEWALSVENLRNERRGASEPLQSPAFEKLRNPLSSLAGKTGFQALLSRALKLTIAEMPRLGGARVTAEGVLEGFADIEPRLSKQEADQADCLLLGHTLELLCTFVGEALTLGIVQDVWPDSSSGKSNADWDRTA